jgi:hypothetical protein
MTTVVIVYIIIVIMYFTFKVYELEKELQVEKRFSKNLESYYSYQINRLCNEKQAIAKELSSITGENS